MLQDKKVEAAKIRAKAEAQDRKRIQTICNGSRVAVSKGSSSGIYFKKTRRGKKGTSSIAQKAKLWLQEDELEEKAQPAAKVKWILQDADL